MKYRVKPGCYHGSHNQHRPGDIVEYEPHEAAGFLDKLEPVEEAAEKPAAEQQPELVTTVKPSTAKTKPTAAKSKRRD